MKKKPILSKKTAEALLRLTAQGRGHVYTYQIVLQPEPEGGYTVLVPSLPGCITYGKTIAKAHEMAEDAIRAYLVSKEKHEDFDPISDSEKQSLISLIEVPLYR